MTDLAEVRLGAVNGSARDTVLLHVVGEVDLSNADDVRDRIGALVSSAAAVVLLDLSDTAYVDSAGIAMIFRLAERLGWSRQELRLVVPPDSPVGGVIRLTNLDRVVPVQERVD